MILRIHHRFVRALLGVLLVAAACERPPRTAEVDLRDDTTAGSPAPAAAADSLPPPDTAAHPPPPDTVAARRVALIGEEEGPPELTFGTITAIAADAAGRLYVSDAMAEDVRVFGPSGAFLHRIGRGGDGPGEFRRPFGLAFAPSGALYVADETRVQRFAPAAGAGEFRYAASFPALAYGFGSFAGRVDARGRYHFRRTFGRIPDQRYFYVVFDSTGATQDTLSVPPSVRMPVHTAILRTSRSGGRMIPGLSRAPFSPVASWDVTAAGTLLVAGGDTYEIVEIGRGGDTLRVMRGVGAARRVPEAERRDSLRAVRARIEAAGVPLDRLEGVAEEIASGRLRRTLPQVLSVHAGTDGWVWVERWPPDGRGGSAYDVLSRDGAYLGTVLVPTRFVSAPSPVFTGTRIYGVVVDEETGVQRVAVFEVPAR